MSENVVMNSIVMNYSEKLAISIMHKNVLDFESFMLYGMYV
jgi:hypothetical protein